MNSPQKTYKAGTLVYTKGALAVLFCWLLWGDFCFVLMEAVVPSIIPLKFRSLESPNTLYSVFMISIPAIIATVCNPIISFKSDRHRSRLGRRIPFILATMPFLVVCLLAIGFIDQIGVWFQGLGYGDWAWGHLHHLFPNHFEKFSSNAAILVVLCLFLTLFSFFNTFVNSVFWYLFNDVIPEQLLARFISWFRIVSVLSGSIYNLFIYKHANTHYTEIFVGAGILYFLGFGLMCLKVREGKYPPPPPYIDGQTGPLAAVKTYVRESLGLKHYWYLFLSCMALGFAGVTSQFAVLLQTELGLSVEQIGRLNFTAGIAFAIGVPIAGWLADRFHPIRIVLLGFFLQLFVIPIPLLWIFWDPGPQIIFYVQLGVIIGLTAPVGALCVMLDPPLSMRIFPRSRYGQFCSANAMLRAFSAIVTGVLIGVYLDVLTYYFNARTAYCCMAVWSLIAHILSFIAMAGLYRSWQRYGGDETYEPPVPK